jgi:hypothetical protein
MRTIARRVGVVSASVLVAGSAFVGYAGNAGAVSNIQTGYWSSLPASPQTPSGGFEVASNPSGSSAVAALRFSLAPGETPTKLDLKAAQAQPASQVAIEACVIAAKSANWQPPSGGPGALSSAPTPDCSSGIVGGVLSADGSSMSFDLSSLSFTGQVNLLLEPSQVANPASGAVPGLPSTMNPFFDAAFEPLTTNEISVDLRPVSSAPAPSDNNTSVSQPAPQPAPAPSGVNNLSLPPSTTTSGGVAPVVAPNQPATTNAASSGPILVKKSRNLRLLFAVAMFSADLLFLLMWAQRHMPSSEREPLSIYDPPPARSRETAPAT